MQGHAQSKLIEEMLLDAVGPTPFEERQLICGDPYSFQGDERDVVFLSMVAATEGDRRMAPLLREQFRQRFNVAASRAKDQLWLFHSVSKHELHPDCMRRRLLEYCYHPRTQVLPQDLSLCESGFERDTASELARLDYRVIPQYPVAGKRIDLVVEGAKTRLAVECDGDDWHGPDRYEADMARQRMLERCGWKFVRIRGSSFYANRQREVARVVEQLHTLGIDPIAKTADECAGAWIEDICGRECAQSLRSPGSPSSEPAAPATEPAASGAPDTAGLLESEASAEPVTAAPECDAVTVPQELAVTDAEPDRQATPVAAAPPQEVEHAQAEGRSTAEEPQPDESLSEDERSIQTVVAFGDSMWLRMSKWGKVNDTLTPKERKFVYDVGQYIREGWQPTIRQARWALKIAAQAIQLGFDPAASE